MKENTVEKLFKEPAEWPLIPPWWFVSSTTAAALLNIKPATLQTWKTRGYGPKPYPPMYLKPTQGRPLYYQYGSLRTWAASRIGMAYTFKDQCMDFFRDVFAPLAGGAGSLNCRIQAFERLFQRDRSNLISGTPGQRMKEHLVHELDTHYARQPRRTNNSAPILELVDDTWSKVL